MRDLVIHGDDLIVGTHGRSFWILDDITPLRQMSADIAKAAATLYHRKKRYVFVGTAIQTRRFRQILCRKNPPMAQFSTTTWPSFRQTRHSGNFRSRKSFGAPLLQH